MKLYFFHELHGILFLKCKLHMAIYLENYILNIEILCMNNELKISDFQYICPISVQRKSTIQNTLKYI